MAVSLAGRSGHVVGKPVSLAGMTPAGMPVGLAGRARA